MYFWIVTIWDENGLYMHDAFNADEKANAEHFYNNWKDKPGLEVFLQKFEKWTPIKAYPLTNEERQLLGTAEE